MSFDRRSRFALILVVLVVIVLAAPLSFAGANNGNSANRQGNEKEKVQEYRHTFSM